MYGLRSLSFLVFGGKPIFVTGGSEQPGRQTQYNEPGEFSAIRSYPLSATVAYPQNIPSNQNVLAHLQSLSISGH